jgi:hypothetical protein
MDARERRRMPAGVLSSRRRLVLAARRRFEAKQSEGAARASSLRLTLASAGGGASRERPANVRAPLVDGAEVRAGRGLEDQRRAAADGGLGAVVLDPHERLVPEEGHEARRVVAQAFVVVAADACMTR